MTMKKKILACTAAVALSSLAANADTLAFYDFSTVGATSVLAGSSSSDLDIGTGWSLGSGTINGDTISITTNGNLHDVSFDFTVGGLGVGESITIDTYSIDLTGKYYNTNSKFSLTSAVNGTAFKFDETYDWGSSETFSKSPNIAGLGNGDTLQVRFSLRDNQTAITESYALDNFTLTGTVVPEPGTYALLGGLLSLGFVMVRRRR